MERISEDIVLISDQFDERVVRLSTSATSASSAQIEDAIAIPSGSTPLDDDDDSPLLFRKETKTVLYGGEEIVLAVTEVCSRKRLF